MGFTAHNLFSDPAYRREVQAWWDELDAFEQEERDNVRREHDRDAGTEQWVAGQKDAA